MKAASLKDLKIELTERSHSELLHVCLQLAKFKKENKEWMTYHLFEAADEAAYVQKVQAETDALFAGLNTKRFFYMKKLRLPYLVGAVRIVIDEDTLMPWF